MAYDFVSKELGSVIGSSLKQASDYKESFVEIGQLDGVNLVNIQEVPVRHRMRIRKKLLATDSFVPDHPVYGYLDSPTLILDGGYTTDYLTTFFVFNVNDVFYDDFYDNSFVDDATTATVDYVNHQVVF